MADPFRSSPARSSPARSSPGPTTPRHAGFVSTRSPLIQRGHSIIPPGPTPSTPTPSQSRWGDFEFMRQHISATDYSKKAPMRNDPIFNEFKPFLRGATTVVTFVWKPLRAQGTFETVPYPVDPATGSLINPQDLPQYLQENTWTRPECLCSIRGSQRTTVLLTPKRSDSPAYGAICLVCPESECPYFVNLDQLFEEHAGDLLASHYLGEPQETEHPTPQNTSAKKRRVIRVPVWRAVLSGVAPPQPPSSSLAMQSNASTDEVVSIISQLLSTGGIPSAHFDTLFLVCDGCDRVMPRVGQDDHWCMVEAASDSGLDEDLRLVLGE